MQSLCHVNVYTLNVQRLVPRMYFLDAYRCFQCEFAHVLITSPQSRPLFPAVVCNVRFEVAKLHGASKPKPHPAID